MKVNALTGNLLWSKIYAGAGNGNDHASAITLDNTGNVYICGISHSSTTDFDMLIVKYNSSGGFQWDYTGGGSGFDRCIDIKVDNSGNVYACGTDVITNVFSKIVTLKFQPDGNQMMYTYLENGIDSNDGASSLAIDAQGNVYTTGFVETLNQRLNIALVKYNPSGTQQWVRYYNGSSNGADAPNEMKIDAAGNIYITGYSYNTLTNLDYITLKYSSSGGSLWTARYIGDYLAGDNYPTGIALDASGNVYVTGRSWESSAGSDITTVKYSSSGSLQWAMKRNGNINSSYLEAGYCIAVDNINNVFVAGVNDAPDAIVIKYVQAPIGIQQTGSELPKQFELGQNYPNPFNPETNIEFSVPNAGFVRLALFDILGREVSELINQDLNAGKYKYNLNAGSLSSGVYFYRLTSGSFSEVKKMNLIK
jgi:hypothetical protein